MEDNRGLIFHTIHGSFVYGHGVRTTIFLKGCPLKCVWCCNPEGQLPYPEIKFTVSKCTGCGKCIDVCPVNAIQNDPGRDNVIMIDREICTNCGKCIEVCFTGALDYFGKYYTVDEVFGEARKDEQYYRSSGGGVTIGGGEPTMQPVFTYDLMKKLQENGIHVGIDTCGYTQTDEGLRILKEADLLLYDLKGMDSLEHQDNTGVKNEVIISNLKMLNSIGKDIIIRLPLIPGYNDSKQSLEMLAEFLSTLKSVQRIDLMAYHQFGRIKYEQLGREYALMDVEAISDERLQQIKEFFESYGLNVQLGG
jgi:pyruvate formate lyase activating enzyme